MATNNASFLPEDYVQKRLELRTNIICLTLFALVMLGVFAAFWVTDRQTAEDQRLAHEVDQQMVEADRRLQQLEEMQARRAQMIQKAKVTSMLLERVPRTMVLSELINSMPKPVCLLEMGLSTRILSTRAAPATVLDKAKLERNKLTSPSDADLKPTEVTLTLVGVAPTDVQVAQFMTTLGKSPIFLEPTLTYTEEMVIEDQHLRKFEMSLTINQEIDLNKIEPKMVKRDGKLDPLGGPIQMDKNGHLTLPAQRNLSGPALVVPAANH